MNDELKNMTILRLQAVLMIIKKGNYFFPANENRARFEVEIDEYLKYLPIKYKIIYREFELNADRFNYSSDTSKYQQIIPEIFLNDLQQKGFIENVVARPLKWTATNKTTKGKNPNKKSLLDLLCLLDCHDDVIKNRNLLNTLFIFPNGKPLTPQNYTDVTGNKGNIIRPIISEYHTELENIVKKSKE